MYHNTTCLREPTGTIDDKRLDRHRQAGDRRQGDRARDGARAAQGRDREALRRRHHAQAKEKQKEGKKKMRQFGKVDIPQETFIAALKVDS